MSLTAFILTLLYMASLLKMEIKSDTVVPPSNPGYLSQDVQGQTGVHNISSQK